MMNTIASDRLLSPLNATGPEYLKHGPIVPLSFREKRPAKGVRWKGDAALTTLTELSQHTAQPHNIALRLDNFLVVDVDGEEGRRSLAKLEAEIGELPRTAVQRSGSGGLHIFFRIDAKDTQRIKQMHADFPKIDFKAGEGHILVMAPSVHPCGGIYELHGDLGEAPQVPTSLLARLKRQSSDGQAKTGSGSGSTGERHNLLVKRAVALFNEGWELGSIQENLEHFVITFNEPWDEQEAQEEIDGVMKWMRGLDSGTLFPRSITALEIAEWLEPRLKGDLVRTNETGAWLLRSKHVFQYIAKDQLKPHLVRTIKPAIEAYRTWMNCLSDETARKKAEAKLNQLTTLGWTDKAIEALGASDQLSISSEELNPPGVINCANGPFTIEGEPAPWAICTKQLGVDFDPKANSCDAFDAFLGNALSEDVRETVLDIVGHALLRKRNSQWLWLFEGPPRAGKSTLLDLFSYTLGDYAVSPDVSLLFNKNASDANGPNENLFALNGAAWAVFPEGPENAPLSPSRCKTLTGGDRLSARQLYGHLTQFENKAEIVIVTNHETRFNVEDEGLRRRVKRILFKHPVSAHKADTDLPEKLRTEGSAILNLLLAHARKVDARGISVCEEIETDTAQLLSNQDILQSFIDEELSLANDARTKGTELYRVYQAWCCRNGINVRSASKFYDALEKKLVGVSSYTRDGAKAFKGVKVAGLIA